MKIATEDVAWVDPIPVAPWEWRRPYSLIAPRMTGNDGSPLGMLQIASCRLQAMHIASQLELHYGRKEVEP